MQWWHLHKFPRGGHDKANRFGALARDSDVKVLGNPLRTWMMWRVILLHLNLGQKILNVIVMNDNLSYYRGTASLWISPACFCKVCQFMVEFSGALASCMLRTFRVLVDYCL